MQSLRGSKLKIGDEYAPPTQGKHLPTLSPIQRGVEGKTVEPPDPLSPRPSPQPSPTKGEGAKTKEEFALRFPISAELEIRYRQLEQEQIKSQLQETQLARVKKALKQAKRKIKGLQEDLLKAEKYKEYGRYGELLKGQLHSLTKGQESVTLVDYYDPSLPLLTLPLESSKDPVWNMEDYFRKHHKYLSAEKHLRPRLESAKQEAMQLQDDLTKIESGEKLITEGYVSHSPPKGPLMPKPIGNQKKASTDSSDWLSPICVFGWGLYLGRENS